MTTKPTQCAQGYDCDACKGIEGMTLRDWFAGRAMQALIANGKIPSDKGSVALVAYAYADAMIKEREI